MNVLSFAIIVVLFLSCLSCLGLIKLYVPLIEEPFTNSKFFAFLLKNKYNNFYVVLNKYLPSLFNMSPFYYSNTYK